MSSLLRKERLNSVKFYKLHNLFDIDSLRVDFLSRVSKIYLVIILTEADKMVIGQSNTLLCNKQQRY
jgi:very-short-patch-repair endonuclease